MQEWTVADQRSRQSVGTIGSESYGKTCQCMAIGYGGSDVYPRVRMLGTASKRSVFHVYVEDEECESRLYAGTRIACVTFEVSNFARDNVLAGRSTESNMETTDMGRQSCR